MPVSSSVITCASALMPDYHRHLLQNNRFRLDRALSTMLMGPISRVLSRVAQPCVSILMYHGINYRLRRAHPYFETNTAPAIFEGHMQFLHDNGYTVIQLDQVVERVRKREKDRNFVAITFDDGYLDFYTDAFPVLRKYNYPATVFVVGTFAHRQYVGANGERYMSWQEIRDIAAEGVQIGSHTMTHRKLRSLDPAEVDNEIRTSKNMIEDKLGKGVYSFAYPFAFPEQDNRFVASIRDLLQHSSYRTGVCTTIGRAHRTHDPLFLPRLPMNSYDDQRLLDVKLGGGYDWLQTVQYAYKTLKSRLS